MHGRERGVQGAKNTEILTMVTANCRRKVESGRRVVQVVLLVMVAMEQER
jgi:hypothetical protein